MTTGFDPMSVGPPTGQAGTSHAHALHGDGVERGAPPPPPPRDVEAAARMQRQIEEHAHQLGAREQQLLARERQLLERERAIATHVPAVQMQHNPVFASPHGVQRNLFPPEGEGQTGIHAPAPSPYGTPMHHYGGHAPPFTPMPQPQQVQRLLPTFKRKYPPLNFKFGGGFVPGIGKPTSSVKDFEYDVRHYLDLHQAALLDNDIKEAQFVMMLGEQTEGLAREWYRRLREAGDPALNGIESYLSAVRNKFLDPNLDTVARHKFAGLRMGTGKGALKAFNSAYNEYVAVIGISSEQDNKFQYMQKLHPDARVECVRLGDGPEVTTLELQQRLERLELARHDAGFYNPTYQSRFGGASSSSAPIAMELGNTWLGYTEGQNNYDRRQRRPDDRSGRSGRGGRGGRGGARGGRGQEKDPEKELKAQRRREGRCFTCGELGHLAADCKAPLGNDQGAQ
jgi:Zinc knuckle